VFAKTSTSRTRTGGNKGFWGFTIRLSGKKREGFNHKCCVRSKKGGKRRKKGGTFGGTEGFLNPPSPQRVGPKKSKEENSKQRMRPEIQEEKSQPIILGFGWEKKKKNGI